MMAAVTAARDAPERGPDRRHRRRRRRRQRRLPPRRARASATSSLLDRDELTSGSTFHSAGPGRAAARRPDADPDEHVLRRALPPAAGRRAPGRLDRERRHQARVQPGAAGGDPPPDQLGAHATACRCTRSRSAEAAERFPLIDTDGRGRRGVPRVRRLPRPVPAVLRARRRRPRRRRDDPHRTPGSLGIDVEGGPGAPGRAPTAATSTARSSSNCGGMFAAEIGRLAGVRIPVVPMSHQYLVTEAFLPRARRAAADAARPRPARLLPAGGRRPGDGRLRARPGALDRDARPRTTRSRPTSTAGCCPRTGRGSRRSRPTPRVRVPAMADVGVRRIINGPEAFTPDNEFCLGETEVAGFFVAAGFCAHGIAGAGGIGKVMAEWIVDGEPSFDVWHMDINRFGRQYRSPRLHPGPHRRELPDATTTSPIPGCSATPAGRCAPARRTRGTASTARSSARSPAGSGSTTTGPTPRAATSRCGPRGWAGRVLVAGDRRRAPRDPRDRRAVRRDVVRQARGQRPGRGRASSSGSATTGSPAASAPSPTPRRSTARGGIEADFTVTRTADDVFLIVTGTAYGTHDLAWLRKQARRRGADVRIADVTGLYACYALWGPRSRDILAHADPGRPVERRRSRS